MTDILYSIQFEKSALKALKKFPDHLIKIIWQEIENLKTNPRPHGCKKLSGAENLYRIRKDNIRIIYQIMIKFY